ncbi:UNVERIFIED_ORG: hypothetical protein J3A77_001071 [Bacillus sp. PvP124]|nr:hypothetical protein [Bacillus sp. PvP124]
MSKYFLWKIQTNVPMNKSRYESIFELPHLLFK